MGIVEVRLPQWGMGMQEGILVEWLKDVGDDIQEDEPLAVVETAKATEQVIAPASGLLESIFVSAGQKVPVGSLLAAIQELAEQ